MKIVACVLLTDFKQYSQIMALTALVGESLIDHIYVNVQTKNQGLYKLLESFASQATKRIVVDYWYWGAEWLPNRKYDQHQVRLPGIVTARNMCIDYALINQATHILFVDSDVIIHEGGVEKLIALNKGLCGGLVPGRGSHSHVNYVFAQKRGLERKGDLLICDHGTAGYMLVSREVFGQLRFRWGDDFEMPQMLSEDPAYALDWWRISGERYIVHLKATADHRDNPAEPLTENGAALDLYSEVMYEKS